LVIAVLSTLFTGVAFAEHAPGRPDRVVGFGPANDRLLISCSGSLPEIRDPRVFPALAMPMPLSDALTPHRDVATSA